MFHISFVTQQKMRNQLKKRCKNVYIITSVLTKGGPWDWNKKLSESSQDNNYILELFLVIICLSIRALISLYTFSIFQKFSS